MVVLLLEVEAYHDVAVVLTKESYGLQCLAVAEAADDAQYVKQVIGVEKEVQVLSVTQNLRTHRDSVPLERNAIFLWIISIIATHVNARNVDCPVSLRG